MSEAPKSFSTFEVHRNPELNGHQLVKGFHGYGSDEAVHSFNFGILGPLLPRETVLENIQRFNDLGAEQLTGPQDLEPSEGVIMTPSGFKLHVTRLADGQLRLRGEGNVAIDDPTLPGEYREEDEEQRQEAA